MSSKQNIDIVRNIYCGFDDSNHCGNNPKGEIIVGVFSEREEDFKKMLFPHRRDISSALDFVSEESRGYLFTELPRGEEYSKHFNLPLVAPVLLQEYLSRNSTGMIPTMITMGFDGPIKRKWKNILEQDLENYDDVKIEYFTGCAKRECPPAVYMADTISNWLFGLTFEEIVTEHEEMVNIPYETLSERLKLFN